MEKGRRGSKNPKILWTSYVYMAPNGGRGEQGERLFTNEEERESARPESDLIPSQSGEQSGAEVTLA